SFQAKGCEVVLSLSAGLALCSGDEKVFIIGGEQLFRESMPLADTLMLTIVQIEVEGDTFFPDFSDKDFSLASSEHVEGVLPYRINTYRKR
ncbi:MAG: dihydrofolate reductase, partial [Desulfobulbaceae bacterium]|nr:dihydrofolate reductase [Desulfobulbaceae bacterium]